jgi:phage gp36-like protein
MSYATTTDLLTRTGADTIAQLVDRIMPRVVTGQMLLDVAANTNLGAYSADQLARAAVATTAAQRALKDATDTIDGYVGTRYTLPLSPQPALLNRIACDMARFILQGDQVPEAVQKKQDAAMKLLADVAAGRLSLGAEAQTGAQPVTNEAPVLVSGERVWHRNQSTGFL